MHIALIVISLDCRQYLCEKINKVQIFCHFVYLNCQLINLWQRLTRKVIDCGRTLC